MVAKNVGSGLLSLFLLAPPLSHAQTAKREFEVASVRPTKEPIQVICPYPCPGPFNAVSGRVNYKNVQMIRLLRDSFVINDDQIEGPNWIQSERYDIAAEAIPNTSADEFREMLKNLLIDRFHMKYHVIQKDFEIYTLTVAKGGPKLKSPAPPDGPEPVNKPGRTPVDSDGFPIAVAGYKAIEMVGHDGAFYLTGRMVPMNELLIRIKMALGTFRFDDKTGLDGKYDVKLKFEDERPVVGAGRADPNGPSDPTPDLFKALEQQLGLKLEKSKAPLDVVVIDRIDKTPTQN